MYFKGDVIPFVLALDGAVAAPAVALLRDSDGYYYDFDDDTWKNAGWTTKQVTLQAVGNVWKHLWDTANLPESKVAITVEWSVDGSLYFDPLLIGHGYAGMSQGEYDAIAKGADFDPVAKTADLANLATRASVDAVKAALAEPRDLLAKLMDFAFGQVVLEDGTGAWVSSGAALAVVQDTTRAYYGNASIRLTLDVAAAAGETATKTLDVPVDLSGCAQLAVPLYSSGAGSFLKLGLQEDGGAWTEWTLAIDESHLDGQWHVATADLTQMAARSAVKHIRLTVLAADIDQSALPGNQLWPSWGPASQQVDVWLDHLCAQRLTSGALAEQLAGGVALESTLQNLNVSVDLSSVAKISDVTTLLTELRSVADVARVIHDYATLYALLDPFNGTTSWVSSDPALNAILDRAEKTFGGASLHISMDTATGQGEYVARTFDGGREPNLTGYDALVVWMRADGYGDYLEVGLHDGTGWTDIAVTVPPANERRWMPYVVPITGVADRSAITGIRFLLNGTAQTALSVDPLWPGWAVEHLDIWIDRLEARKTFAAPASDWVS